MRKVLWTCAEIGLPYVREDATTTGTFAGVNELKRLNTNGLVPASPLHTDRSAVEASVRSWNAHIGIIENRLAETGAFVVGPSFSLADVVLGLSVNRWFMTPMERPDLPAVCAYFGRLSSRPGFAEHVRNGVP